MQERMEKVMECVKENMEKALTWLKEVVRQASSDNKLQTRRSSFAPAVDCNSQAISSVVGPTFYIIAKISLVTYEIDVSQEKENSSYEWIIIILKR